MQTNSSTFIASGVTNERAVTQTCRGSILGGTAVAT